MTVKTTKLGTANVQQSSALSGMSELIPLLCKRCPGICQDSHRQNTGTSDRETSLNTAGSCTEGREGVSPPGSPAMSTYCHLSRPWEATFSCCNPIWQTSTQRGVIYSSFVCCLFFSQELNLAKQRCFSCFLLALLFFCPCVLSGDTATCGSYSYKAVQNCWITHPAHSRNQCVLMGTYIWLLGEGSELSIFQGSPSF